MTRTETITVYLLKDSVRTASVALKPDLDTPYSEHALIAGETVGTVYLALFEDKEPDWIRLLGPVTQPVVNTRIRSASALLVLSAAGRWFGITFGHGRHMLDPEIYIRRFGLRVALNAADPTQLRGAQARSFNGYALHTDRQVSRLTGVEALELDIERDLVTAMSGALSDVSLGKRVEGRDAVRITAELDIRGLAALCASLFDESQRTTYREHYPWIDNVEEITDPAMIVDFERRTAKALGERRFSEFDLFPPELVSDEIVRFKTSPSKGGLVVVEPDSSLLRFPLHAPTDASRVKMALRRYKLIGIDAGGNEVDRWSFWDCLHYEFGDTNSHTIILDGGRWYRVAQGFANNVEHFINGLGSSGLALPPALNGETEGDYNIRAAKATGMTLLDERLIRLAGQSALEPCDLLSPEGHFIHVKHRKGGSAPLSHLFGQALVSAECLVSEPEFREKLRQDLATFKNPPSASIAEPPLATNYPVVLGLITRSATPGSPARDLPFFSKVFLRQAVRRMQAMNFHVYVDEIPTVLQPSASRPNLRRAGRAVSANRQKVTSRSD